MGRVEKTVFISYRRVHAGWAQSISADLTHHGYDVFFDLTGIASGDFERIILENIRARAHFLVVLASSSLERVNDPGDLFWREIESAMQEQRNVVPLFLEGFDFDARASGRRWTGRLKDLSRYNGLAVSAAYFACAMKRLREKYLNVSLDAVLHPASPRAVEAARKQQDAARAAPNVEAHELTAVEWFERGSAAIDPDEQVRCYTESIHLKPEFAEAHNNRGVARNVKRDYDGALADYSEAIRLRPDFAEAYINRGATFCAKRDYDSAVADLEKAIRLRPDSAEAYNNRGVTLCARGDHASAVADLDEAIRLRPDYAEAYDSRADARRASGDLDGAVADYTEAIRLRPDLFVVYKNRASVLESKENYRAAIDDLERYLKLGGGQRDGDQVEVERRIRELKRKLPRKAPRNRGKSRG